MQQHEKYSGAGRDGETMKRIILAAKDDRTPYIDTGEEIEKYGYAKDYEFLYQTMAEQMPDLFFKARVNKASEFVEVMGPHLYPYDPYYLINPEEGTDQWTRERLKVEQRYVNHLTRACHRYRHGRDAVTHGLTFGRGVLWTGYNERKGLVQSVSVHSKDLLLDPDARSPEEINILIRRRIKPRWEMIKAHPDCREFLLNAEKCGERSTDAKNTRASPVSDLIEYFECYLLVGIHNYYDDMTYGGEVSDAPMKYVVCDNYVLSKGDWDIPYWLASRWPCNFLDLKRRPGKLWPQAPLEPGLGHIRALNWIYTLYLSKMRFTTRTPLAVMSLNGQGLNDDQIVSMMHGGQMDVIKFTVNGETLKLSDFVQQFKFETGVEELERFVGIVGKEFANSTGLGEIMYFGQTETQLRTAADVQLKADTSKNRTNDMKTSVEKFMAEVAETELFAARFLERTPERITKLFGQRAGDVWGTLASPEEVEAERQYRQQMVEQQAPQMMQMAYQNAQMTGVPFDPAQAQQQAMEQATQTLPPPQLVDFEEWLNEADCDVEYGSMRPKNLQQQIDASNVAMNQLPAVIANLPGGAQFIAAIVSDFTHLNNMSDDLKAASKQFQETVMSTPMMPVPAAAPADETQEAP